ncbi:tetratricopeptide repeat-containing sensor histidine kinase [Winogradskyella vidalii]|uniref:tetratricopeptide repeat-containing sensor histidine kinase n=1 Tax=Winogradskyella vidalii TaxID=2615024 RepID=UPI0015CCE521|nr:tetratricopeptide repeat protein [Winogradskyella vidalii]
MKYIYLLIALFITIKGVSQVDAQKQQAIDSAYYVASNVTKPMDVRLKAFSYCCWKTVYLDFNQGLKYSAEYLKLAKTSKHYKRTSQAYHFLGHSYLMLGQIENAKITLIEGLDFSIQHKIYSGVAKIYGDLGNLNNSIGNTSLALDYHFKSLEIANKHGINVEYARSKINIGEIYEAQGHYRLSLETFEEVLNFCIDHNYVGYKASIYESLGDVNITIKEYQTAEKNYLKAIAYAKKLTNNNRLINSLKKLGELHQELKNLEKAEINYKEALHIAITSKATILEAKVRANLAHINLQKNQIKEAKNNITLAITQFESLKIKEDLDKAYIIAAETYQVLNQKKESFTYYQKAYNIAKITNHINTLKLASLGLGRAYENQGDLAKAIAYYKEFNSYSNKIRSEEGIRNIIRLEIKDVYQQKSIADSINKVNEIKLLQFNYDQKEERNKLKIYTAISSIIILLLIVLCITYFYNQKKKVAAVLSQKNKTIEEALNDKEILLKEVHHRVKNNMQIVASLLYLKSKNTENKIAKEALIDSKTRIDAMQLAHQKMYQKGNYRQIDIVEYFNNIMHLLLSPIQLENDNFTVQGNNLWVDVEQAQALGFILHELITNSIKYAWPKTKTKEVKISISKKDDTIQFDYADNGIGLPKTIDITTTKSFGLKLIYSIATRQLLGKTTICNSNGFAIKITFNAR